MNDLSTLSIVSQVSVLSPLAWIDACSTGYKLESIKDLNFKLGFILEQGCKFLRTTFIFDYSNFWSICTLFARMPNKNKS